MPTIRAAILFAVVALVCVWWYWVETERDMRTAASEQEHLLWCSQYHDPAKASEWRLWWDTCPSNITGNLGDWTNPFPEYTPYEPYTGGR